MIKVILKVKRRNLSFHCYSASAAVLHIDVPQRWAEQSGTQSAALWKGQGHKTSPHSLWHSFLIPSKSLPMLENQDDSNWYPLCTVKVGPMWHVLGLWPLPPSHETLALVEDGVRAEDLRVQWNRSNWKTKKKKYIWGKKEEKGILTRPDFSSPNIQ